MPNKRHKLVANFQAGRQYMLDGSLINELIRAINRNTPIAGINMESSQQDDGIILNSSAVGGVAAPVGAFCEVFQDSGNWMLLGGTITGGIGNESIAAITIGTVGSEPADGTFVWIRVNYTAQEEDDVLLPGGELISVTTGSGGSLPSNDIPTVTSTTGHIYISLGQWLDGEFAPSGCGDIQVFHCPGNLSYSRG